MKSLRQSAVLTAAATLLIGVVHAAEPPHRHHHAFAKDVDAFHGVLAPVWHGATGEARNRDACTKSADMETLAKAIRSTDAKALIAATGKLSQQCADKGNVEGALIAVHDAFHHLIDRH